MPKSESRALRGITLVSASIAGLMVVVLMLLTVVDVTLRTLGRGGVPGGVEWTEVALVVAVFCGMMAAEFDDAHVRTPIMTDRLKLIASSVVRLVGTLAVSVLVVWMIIATAQTAWVSFSTGEVHPGITRVPVWPAKLIIPIGMLGMLVVLVVRAVERIGRLRDLLQNQTDDQVNMEVAR